MISELKSVCKIIENADLTKYNTFRLHSECYVLAFIKDLDELKNVVSIVNKYKSKWFIIGNGSNIILPDYYDGVIIKLNGLNKCIVSNNEVYIESGCMINKVANELANNGYAGLDFACGIPGSIGGCIYGNAGCYGSSISEVLISAIVYDGKNIVEMSNEDFKFSYRYSILKEKNNYIVLSAKFKIYKKDKNELKEIILDRMKKRKETQDLLHPSNGSVFRNPEGLSAGKLIDDAKLKGFSVNDASVSNKHANFIINNGNATSEDIIKLIKIIKKEIKKIYNVDLVLEQEIIK